MPELYEITVSQATAMSAADAQKYLEKNEELEGEYGEAWDRQCKGYVFDENGEMLSEDESEVPEAVKAWKHLKARGVDPEGMECGELLSLDDTVKSILEEKAGAEGGRRRKGKKSRKSRKTRKGGKSRKSRKVRKTRKH